MQQSQSSWWTDCKRVKGACRSQTALCPQSPVLVEEEELAAVSSHITSLPALSYVPQPGLVPDTPTPVQSHQGVVETSPGGLTEFIYRAWLACIGINKIHPRWNIFLKYQTFSSVWARFQFVFLSCPVVRKALAEELGWTRPGLFDSFY